MSSDDELQRLRDQNRKLEEEREDLQRRLLQGEKMASLGRLVAGVAHEINTPLGALSSNTDLFIRACHRLKGMLADSSMPPEVRENEGILDLLRSIEELNEVNKTASSRIVQMVNSLRTFARLDHADMDEVDIHTGIESTLTLVHHKLKGRIDVRKEFGNLPEIRCYPNQLNQVFLNLLVNASQAIDGPGTIFIRTFLREPWVVIEIEDTGKGMPDEIKRRIFDAGFTTKGSGTGTGLGLSIVRQIVSEHGGKIEVESEVGKGTTFRILLPAKLEAGAPEPPSPSV